MSPMAGDERDPAEDARGQGGHVFKRRGIGINDDPLQATRVLYSLGDGIAGHNEVGTLRRGSLLLARTRAGQRVGCQLPPGLHARNVTTQRQSFWSAVGYRAGRESRTNRSSVVPGRCGPRMKIGLAGWLPVRTNRLRIIRAPKRGDSSEKAGRGIMPVDN